MLAILFGPFPLFLILVIWALIQGDMYAKEAIIWGSICLACFLALFFIPVYGLYFIAPVYLIDIVLLIKLVGNPSVT